MNLFSHIIVLFPIIYIGYSHIKHTNKGESFYNFFIVSTALNISIIAKLFIRENRPFLTEGNIQALNCECSFGMPSGHACTSTVGVLVMLEAMKQLRRITLKNKGD